MKDLHRQPIHHRVQWLIEHAARYTTEYTSPDSSLARQLYRARHPTAIAVMKCMDGRINIPFATETPLGIIQPFRNLGGLFDLGWPHLGEVVANYVHKRVDEGRQVLMLVTYHFSRGDTLRGCAGFGYDTAAAHAATRALKGQFEAVFGRGHGTVYPLICGFETDEDALILHGCHTVGDNMQLDLSVLTSADSARLPDLLARTCPDMPERLRTDLLPLLEGNLRHIQKIRQSHRAPDIEHHEWMICLGRGFDFLHIPNLALIVGPYSPQLADPISKAAGIIESNMRHGRIPDDGFLLLTSSPYDEPGSDRARAELKARFLNQFARQIITDRHPELAARMHPLTAVLDVHTRRLEVLSET